VQRLLEPGDEGRVGGTISRLHALQVEVEPVVALGDDVLDDLVDGPRGDGFVGQETMVQPAREGQQGGEDLDPAPPSELLERLVVATAELAASVDRDPLRRDDIDRLGVRDERGP